MGWKDAYHPVEILVKIELSGEIPKWTLFNVEI